jgi:hypothetical protein
MPALLIMGTIIKSACSFTQTNTQCGFIQTNLDFHLLISFVILSFFQVITQLLNNSYTQPYSYHMEFSPFPFVFVDRLPSSAVFAVGATLPWLGLGGL